ncbi:MAG: peptide-methionine (R)-S-oxide reductase MsrB [Robiginitomaculum sp.]|nr:peptide-methionine (R)-S-oxide reductase MsrB [Robiginitomaculum sp.]
MTKKILTEQQARIAEEQATEPPFSGPWLDEKRDGVYLCVACGHELFSSDSKYDSGSGWPSFWKPTNDQALGSTTDTKLGMTRVEVHCDKCKAHMGHVFDDGPQPTGLRYCVNGSVLDFKPTD